MFSVHVIAVVLSYFYYKTFRSVLRHGRQVKLGLVTQVLLFLFYSLYDSVNVILENEG